MKFCHLKTLRVVIAVVFFAFTAFLFLDFRELGARAVARETLYLQFVPSLLKFLNQAAMGAAGFIFVLILTLLFGRIYCSTICPLGTLQDMVSRLAREKGFGGKKAGKRPRYSFAKPHDWLRYGVLFVTVALFMAGSGLLLNILDPFSNFGRFFSNLVRPVVLVINNLGAVVAEKMGSHVLYRVQWPAVAPVSVIVALVMLGLVGWLAARHGRLYCNTVCPVGALLGIFSRVSLFKIRFSPSGCKDCGLCERVCKSGCIDYDAKTIDASRCVACFNCLAACPDQSLGFGIARREGGKESLSAPGRRGFLIAIAASGMGTMSQVAEAVQKKPIQSKPTTIPEKKTSPATPPGSMSIEHFTSICTACHLCVSACPSRVLVPSLLEFGLSGIMQPRMDFRSGHCNFDCTACSDICPSGAILPIVKERKQLTQIGVAKFIRENCVVYTDNTNCGACSEHCPTKAVRMVPHQNPLGRKLVIPEVKEKLCIGCGGCEHACPTKPYKAIYVNGNPVHKLAQKPVETKLENPMDTEEDFPF